MRILSLTAGAAGMYCGTCMRDNALATELLAQGHDVLLVPFYTPTLTDERNVSYERVFFGGVSVYLQQHVPIFRKTPAFLDRLWDSPWALKAATSRSISTDPKMLGELTVSMLKAEHGPLRKEVRKLTDWLRTEPAPDVIDLPYSLLIGLAEPLKRALNGPVCCTLQGEDLFLSGLVEPYKSEALALIRSNLRHVDTFIAVSAYYADFMSSYLDIPRMRIQTVPLGINLSGHAWVDRPRSGPLRIGYFARIAPEKGLHILCEALASEHLRGCDLRVDAAGFLPPEHRVYLAAAERRMKDVGLSDRFRYHGSIDREAKIRFLQNIDVLSVPSTYDEPKGIFLFEAMANGAAVVQPRRGAYPEILAQTGGGLLVEPDDPESLAQSLRTLYDDRELLDRLARQGHRGVREHYSIGRMARRTLEVYSSVVSPAVAGA